MTEIQKTIASYMKDKRHPSEFDRNCFIGMIETGEATYNDFRAVGGETLVMDVAHEPIITSRR